MTKRDRELLQNIHESISKLDKSLTETSTVKPVVVEAPGYKYAVFGITSDYSVYSYHKKLKFSFSFKSTKVFGVGEHVVYTSELHVRIGGIFYYAKQDVFVLLSKEAQSMLGISIVIDYLDKHKNMFDDDKEG